MNNVELINLMLPVMGFMVIVFLGYHFMMQWRSDRERDFEMRKEELQFKREQLVDATQIKFSNETQESYGDLGGYVTIEIPEERKSIFQDILKGFEEYSQLKGYRVSISTDASEPNKISLKITILDFGVTANRTSVKQDLGEYIRKIQEGNIQDDMPEIINPVDHSRIVMALKNRISFLQQNYEVERNIREFYQRFVERLPLGGFSHGNPIFNISNQGSAEMDKRRYISNRSANVIQGDDHQNLVESGNISIGVTVKEKTEQVEKLAELIEELSLNPNNDDHQKAIRQCENIKDELLDEEIPDEGMIGKWLNGIGR